MCVCPSTTRDTRTTRTIEKHTTKTETAYRSLEETSMLNWDQDKEQYIRVLATHTLAEETREVIG